MTDWHRKVDHRLRALWDSVPEEERGEHTLRVFLRFTGSPAALRACGARLGTIAGDIATATVSLADLARLAEAKEVVYIELSQPLGPD